MECAFEAQNLISISLRKIQSSRTQRGGIKLHKNLLVTYVLRNARQFYMSKDFVQAQSRAQQYEDVIATTREKPDYLELTGSFTELADDFYCNFGEAADDESDSWHCGGAHGGHPAESAAAHQDASACAMAASLSGDSVSSSSNNIMLSSEASSSCWSCGDKVSNAWDLIPAPIAQQQQQQQANQKTVLDLDTHVVTTVTNGYFHSDCCAPAIKPQGAQAYCNKKRKLDSSYHIVDPEFYWPDLGPSWPSKRMRTEDESHSDSEQLDTTNISNLISVLGSGGLTEFMSWQHTDLEQIFTAQTICLRHTLLTGSAWTRAIEAF